jgi:hypothetical protein
MTGFGLLVLTKIVRSEGVVRFKIEVEEVIGVDWEQRFALYQ